MDMMKRINSSGKEISKMILKTRLVKLAEVEDYRVTLGSNPENPLNGFAIYNDIEVRSLTK